MATNGLSPRLSNAGREGQGMSSLLLVVPIRTFLSHLQAPVKVGLGVLDLASANASSGAEVPIPVFADVSNTTPSRPSGQDAADPQETSHKESVPTISITKPPAPLP